MSSGDGYGDERAYGAPRRAGTRVRLPDDELPADARTPAVRPGRSLLTVVGVVVLLIAAIAFATRGGGDGGDDGAGGAQANPTAPTGTTPVDAPPGTLPSGFPRTPQGAQSAAANYVVALVSAEIIKPEERRSIVAQVFTPDQVDTMTEQMERSYTPEFLEQIGLDAQGDAPQGYTYVSRTVPVGTKVVDYAEDTARLEVWCTGVYGMAGPESRTPVTTDWFTMTLTLRWSEGDWKVAEFTQQPGPAPVNGDLRASSADEIAEAVEGYGGFTYAR
ncbi:hypothetical protein WDH52_14740 [Streptomyces sp. TRM70308]|uniref:hypothetical protein n=1 Tax=Streptomyces sp. TRM70308 TaxID=3131932 RepID=UPI003D032E69